MKDNLTHHIKPGTKERKSMRSLKRDSVIKAINNMTGLQALKFMHPRSLREKVLQKQVPDHVTDAMKRDE